jgi:hypothetical protein
LLFFVPLTVLISTLNNVSTVSPLKVLNFGTIYKFSSAVLKKETVGFMPYWLLDNINIFNTICFGNCVFSLTVDENGDIKKVVGTETDPGWRWWNSLC